MRYNHLDAMLPERAFSPRGGRHNPFVHGMTLEGGVVKAVTGAVSGVARGVTQAVKAVVQPVYNATLKQIPGVDKALVGLDKAVGNTIPGGWGTVAAMAVPFIPGAQFGAQGLLSGITKTQLATGIGALSGSGVMRKGHQFDLQGAIMGGAMAYGGAQLAEGLQAAGSGSAAEAAEKALNADTARIAAQTGVEGASTAANNASAMLARPEFGGTMEAFPRGFADAIPKGAANLQAANVGLSNLASNPDVFSGLSGTQAIVPQPSGLSNLATTGSETLSNLGQAGQGIKNLTGFGPDGISGISQAASRFAGPVTQTGLAAGIIGTTGMMALEEQRKMLDEQFAQGSIAQAEYDKAKAEIDRQVQIARETVAANPFRTDTNVSGSLSGSGSDSPKAYETLYAAAPSSTATLYANKPYAMGGSVDDELGGDYSAMGMDQGNLRKGLFGLGYAAGGMPRFLSGGGDGMSDSIRANINGTQEARLADGEFVIPADVVSHLGNGSSKAGAKQLYAMMDKVRKARTGRKSQGKQINPRKYLLA
jgi:hypothetical protein